MTAAVPFNVAQEVEDGWRVFPAPRATPADIAFIERSLDVVLPPAYVDFVTRHGFVVFGRDRREHDVFTWIIDEGGQPVAREGDIGFLFEPELVVKIARYMVSTEFPDDETRPMIPPGYLPVGSDAGHGRILLDVRRNPGQVLYWPQSDERWGEGENVALGVVADDFATFINGLRPNRP